MRNELQVWTLILAMALTFVVAPAAYAQEGDVTDPVQPISETTETEEQTVKPAGLDDPEELLDQYVQTLSVEDGEPGVAAKSRANKLSGAELNAYNALKGELAKIASGESNSTKITISFQDIFEESVLNARYTAGDLGVETIAVKDGEPVNNVQNYKIADGVSEKLAEKYALDTSSIFKTLVYDCPQILFWLNKSIGMKPATYTTTSAEGNHQGEWVAFCNAQNSYYEFYFAVADDYRPSMGAYAVYNFGSDEAPQRAPIQTDAGKIATIQEAISDADQVVTDAASKTDIEKLRYYKQVIEQAVSYDHGAAETNASYGDPWQMIYVFDKDPATNVVCEGYSKAFKYLCDKTDFSDASLECYLVTGDMSGGTGAGAHMWNLVSIAGQNYLVDLTNCDEGSVGYPDHLFLKGDEEARATGYTIHVPRRDIDETHYTEAVDIVYAYDDASTSLYTDAERTLATADYTPDTTGGDNDDNGGTGDSGNTGGDTGDQGGTGENTGGNTGNDSGNQGGTGDNTGNQGGTGENIGNQGDTGENTGGNSGNTNATPDYYDISRFNLPGVGPLTYTGSPWTLKPEIRRTVNGVESVLKEGTDFTVTYKDNTNVGTATATITGKGQYHGTLETHYEIVPRTITPTVSLSRTAYTYNGRVQTPGVTVRDHRGFTLKNGTDYTVSYTGGRQNYGTYKITVTLKGNYRGSKAVTYRINKANNPLVAKGKAPTVKVKAVKKKAQTIKRASAFAISKNQGAVTYKKASGNSKITVAKNGNITVKKKTGKGTYKIKVKVTAAGNTNYKAVTKTVTVTVKVK